MGWPGVPLSGSGDPDGMPRIGKRKGDSFEKDDVSFYSTFCGLAILLPNSINDRRWLHTGNRYGDLNSLFFSRF